MTPSHHPFDRGGAAHPLDRHSRWVGVDLGGTSIKWTVLDRDNTVIHHGAIPTPTTGAEACLAAVADIVTRLEAPSWPVAAVAVPASLDPVTGRVIELPNIPGRWRDVPIADRLADMTGHTWRVVNDARAFAAGELAVGVARGFSDVLFITLGTGVGGALALHGEVEMGTAGFIGEIGHVPYRRASPRPCGCGSHGCLETYAGAAGMLAESARRGLAREPSDDTSPPGRLEALFDAARGGDGVAADIVSQAGGALGAVVGWLSTFLAPDLVVIGGGVTKGFDVLDPAFRAELAHNVRIVRPPTVRLTRQPDLAGAIGAAIWAGQTATATSRPKRRHA